MHRLRGRIAPADRGLMAALLAGRFTGQDVHFAVEGCMGWANVAEELAATEIAVRVAEPAETAALRGRNRHAKSDPIPGTCGSCWPTGGCRNAASPPWHVLECRALLETFMAAGGAHRLSAADPGGAVPPGRAIARRWRARHWRGPSRSFR